MTKEEKMMEMKCSLCNKDMQMPVSFLKKIPGGKAESIPHICDDCMDRAGEHLGGKKMKNFVDEINQQMEKLGKNNELAEKIAEEITNYNLDILLDEFHGVYASEEDKIKESFFRGVWTTLFLISNNHDAGFLEKEAEKIRDFHEKMRKREKNEEQKTKNKRK